MEDLFELLNKNSAIPPLLEKKGFFVVDDGIGSALLLASAFKKKKDKYIVICSNLHSANRLYNNLCLFLNKDEGFLYPSDEIIRIDSIATSKDLSAERIFVLDKIMTLNAYIVVTHIAAINRYLPSPELFKKSTLHYKVGDTISIKHIAESLAKSGYVRVNKVNQSLQFALRGDIVDIYSLGFDNPIRLEFFDEEIETIKYFDVGTQTSLSSINEVKILPASDFLLDEVEVLDIENKILRQTKKDFEIIGTELGEKLLQKSNYDIDRFMNGENSPSLYKYYSFLQNNHYSIFDYSLGTTFVYINEDQLDISNETILKESRDYFSELFEEGNLISHLELLQDFSKLKKGLKPTVKFSSLKAKENAIDFAIRPISLVSENKDQIKSLINHYQNENYKIVVALATKQQLETIVLKFCDLEIKYEYVDANMLPEGQIGVSVFPITEGFELVDEKVVFLSSKELFNFHQFLYKQDKKFKEGKILRSYEELEPGDYVVHEKYGIGQFIDIKTIEVDGMHRDFIHIAYAGNDILYVPLFQFQLVRKYIGKEGYVPKLNHLNSKEWEKTKSRIKEKVNDIAERLIALYNARSTEKGFAFVSDDEIQNEFESHFNFELTPDQKISLEEVKKDMESPYPMDRLLCGDVGFGKTEIAFRAAFKAILSGKQVMFLCPTTLLARQHYERAIERFKDYGVRIVQLSRLVPASEQKNAIKCLKDGSAHMVIGTHRLLSKEIKVKDLGLLIVDEEQRFGVEQKEKIKELKSNIDVLTLSATPIPRTLQMSLVNIRKLSQINTPPQNRFPVQTYVVPFDYRVVKEIIERELARNGQVFYLHNEVYSIYSVANKIQSLVSDARIGVVHGKLTKDEIEDVMIKFYAGEINVLICTSIIENGIDIENANTIIIEKSDRFGLAQLYQIKGRVGRGSRIAYAYLTYTPNKVLNETAVKRLKAIQDFAELGSGYKIAQRDLIIRGAGDILGKEQAGFIDSIGIDLYIKMLNEAIHEKETGEKEEIQLTKVVNVDAYIPNEYASKPDKIDIYHDIDSVKSTKDLEKVKRDIRDIYGKIPKEVELLIIKKRIDLLINERAFEDLIEYPTFLDIILSNSFTNLDGVGYDLFVSLEPFKDVLDVTYNKRTLKVRLKKNGQWLETLEQVLKIVIDIYKKRSFNEKENIEKDATEI